MKWMPIGVGVIFLVCFLVGIWKGALKIAVSIVTTVITLALVMVLSPYVSKAIVKYTPIDDFIMSQVESTVRTGAGRSILEGEWGGMTEEEVMGILNAAGLSKEDMELCGITMDKIINGEITQEQIDLLDIGIKQYEGDVEADIPKELQVEAIKKSDIPEIFKTLLSNNNNSEIYRQLGVTTFAEYAGEFLASLAINMTSFLVTFILATLIIRAVIFGLDIVSELPGVGFVNRLGGGMIGLLSALVIVWTLFVLVTLLYITPLGKEAYDVILSHKILKVIYENNPILILATKWRG